MIHISTSDDGNKSGLQPVRTDQPKCLLSTPSRCRFSDSFEVNTQVKILRPFVKVNFHGVITNIPFAGTQSYFSGSVLPVHRNFLKTFLWSLT